MKSLLSDVESECCVGVCERKRKRRGCRFHNAEAVLQGSPPVLQERKREGVTQRYRGGVDQCCRMGCCRSCVVSVIANYTESRQQSDCLLV